MTLYAPPGSNARQAVPSTRKTLPPPALQGDSADQTMGRTPSRSARAWARRLSRMARPASSAFLPAGLPISGSHVLSSKSVERAHRGMRIAGPAKPYPCHAENPLDPVGWTKQGFPMWGYLLHPGPLPALPSRLFYQNVGFPLDPSV